MLKPKLRRVALTAGRVRYLLTLERPEGTNAVWIALDITRAHIARTAKPAWRVRGFTFEAKHFPDS